MKLLADATLGRLAKWLRILGYDTVYLTDTDDYAVMRLARAEDRVILTRDRGLVGRRGVRAVLVESGVLEDQLQQVRATIGPPPDPSLARCPLCNEPLAEVESEFVLNRVPPYVVRTKRHFSFCAACDQVYWQGTHWQRMQALIAGLRDEAGSDTIGREI